MKNIENYREEIDVIDFKIIELLAERMKIVREIGQLKKKNNIPILDEKRYGEIMQSRAKLSEELGLDEKSVKSIFQTIHKAAIKLQKNI